MHRKIQIKMDMFQLFISEYTRNLVERNEKHNKEFLITIIRELMKIISIKIKSLDYHDITNPSYIIKRSADILVKINVLSLEKAIEIIYNYPDIDSIENIDMSSGIKDEFDKLYDRIYGKLRINDTKTITSMIYVKELLNKIIVEFTQIFIINYFKCYIDIT